MPELQQSHSGESNPVHSLAEETRTSIETVQSLYDEEVATLRAEARVTAFIAAIAKQKVKRRLKQRRH